MTLAGDQSIDELMLHYEGLVCRTAQMLCDGTHPDLHGKGPVEQEIEDVKQILRMKVHRAVLSFDPSKVRQRPNARQRYGSSRPIDKARDGYVNMCVRDQAKDVAKKKRRGELMIEDLAPTDYRETQGVQSRDRFERRYMSEDHDVVFAEVEDQLPAIPNTLTVRERDVLVLMYRDYRQTEIAGILGITKREVESAVRGIRTKMSAWRPQKSEAPSVAA